MYLLAIWIIPVNNNHLIKRKIVAKVEVGLLRHAIVGVPGSPKPLNTALVRSSVKLAYETNDADQINEYVRRHHIRQSPGH